MDYDKLLKQELIDLLKKKDEDYEFIKNELQQSKQLRDEAVHREFNARKEMAQLSQQLTIKEKEDIISRSAEIEKLKLENTNLKSQSSLMQKKFNELAGLFEEYVTSFKDQQVFLGLYLKSVKNTEELLNQKINHFNEGGAK